MAMSQRTAEEMTAGARLLAAKEGRVLPADYMARLVETHTRAMALRRWEQLGLLRIERKRDDYSDTPRSREAVMILHHVKEGPTFLEEPGVAETGGYPSELLTANIALAIAAMGGG